MSVQTKYFDEDGKIVVNRSQDIQRILDFNKERNIDGHNRKSDMRLAGSIPFVVIEMWMKECGAKLGSQELNEYIKKKLMSGEFSKLVANGYQMDLPKVNIAVAASAVVAIVSTVGGGIWYASQQASIIESLTEQVNTLTIENNATDRTNLIRDVQKNQEDLQEIIDILAEFYEEMEDADDEIWEDIDVINEDLGGMAAHMMEIIKLQSRIAVIEKTMQYTKNDGM